MKTVKIKAQGADYLPIDNIHDFQGELKQITREDLDKLKENMKKRFIHPFSVWQNKAGKMMAIDMHQRKKALEELFDEGYSFQAVDQNDKNIDVPENYFPVNYIYAKTRKEAAENLLMITSQYGEITRAGIIQFAEQFKLDLEKLNLKVMKHALDLSGLQDDLDIDDFFEDENIPEKKGKESHVICPECGTKIQL